MKVPFSYLDRQFANVDDYLRDVRALVLSGDFTLGKPLTEFEQSFAQRGRGPRVQGIGRGQSAAQGRSAQ